MLRPSKTAAHFLPVEDSSDLGRVLVLSRVQQRWMHFGLSLGELVWTPVLPAAPVNHPWELLPLAWEACENLRDGDEQKWDEMSDERLKSVRCLR